MWLSIIGVALASVTAVFSTVRGDGTTQKKLTLVLLAIAGLVVGLYSAVDGDREKRKDAQTHALEVQNLANQLTTANAVATQIKKAQSDQEPLLRYVTASVGDLGALNALSGGHKYFVRIAAASNDRGRADLEATKARIEAEFKGAMSSEMVAILPVGKERSSVQLVFGRNLNFAAAEVFLRLAVSHHLANGQPQIFPERELQRTKQ